MKFSAAMLSSVFTLWGFPAFGSPILIDSFDTPQSLSLSITSSMQSQVVAPEVIGGERDLHIQQIILSGTSVSELIVASGKMTYTQTPSDNTVGVSFSVQYDGLDGASSFDVTGLGGFDLTAGGTQNQLQIRVLSNANPIPLQLVVRTDGTNRSSWLFTLPGGIVSPTDIFFDFAAPDSIIGTGADFTNVGMISFGTTTTPTPPVDLELDFIQTSSTAVVPEPSSLTLLGLGGLCCAGMAWRRRGRRLSHRRRAGHRQFD